MVSPGCCRLPGRRCGFLRVEAQQERAIPTAALPNSTGKHCKPQPHCFNTGRASFLVFYHSWPLCSRSLKIAAGGKQRKRLMCFVRGASNSAKDFPFPKPTTVLPGGSAPRSAICPQFRGTPARRQQGEGIARDSRGGRNGGACLPCVPAFLHHPGPVWPHPLSRAGCFPHQRLS